MTPDQLREKVAREVEQAALGYCEPGTAADRILALLPLPVDGWRPIETAPKDGTPILAIMSGADSRWSHLNGRTFVVRHDGTTASGYDRGWSVYPGMGGAPDEWFTHWMPLPKPPAAPSPEGEKP